MINFKDESERVSFVFLHKALLMIFLDMSVYAEEKHGVDLVVTDTISNPLKDKKLGRTSDSHQMGICIDFRTRDIDPFVLQDIIDYIESKPEYEKYKYLSYSGEKRLVYIHNNGNGEHGHMGINRKYAREKLYNLLEN